MRRVVLLVALALSAQVSAATDEPPWLGVGIEPGRAGVRVIEVIPGTPAEYIGLVVGDEIESIDGFAVALPDQLIDVVRRRRVGDAIELTYRRGGKRVAVKTTLTAKFDDEELLQRRLVDRPALGFALDRAGGGQVELAALAGKVVVIEFMATWCAPCKSTYRALDKLDGHPDIVVVGLSSEAPALLEAFGRSERIGFALLHDPGDAVRRGYFAGATPTLVVIDEQGRVTYAAIGAGLGLDHAVHAARSAARSLGD